jgi:CRP-like cAMP-binding protein
MHGYLKTGLDGTGRGVPLLSKFSLERVTGVIIAVTQFLRRRNDLAHKRPCRILRAQVERGTVATEGKVTRMARALREQWGELRPGDHIAFLYEDAAELTSFAVSFIKDGLARGERCVYIVGEVEPTEVTEALVAGGVDVNRAIERGALIVLSPQEYFALPPFDASRVVELMRKRATEAISRGFAGLRIAGEMTWTLQKGIRDDELLGFESLVDRATGPGLLTAACMYRRDRFPPAVLQRLVRSHAKVVAGDHVYLSLSALFQTLARSDLQGLVQSAGERRVRQGDFYFHQGDQATEVYVLTSGEVKVVRADPNGQNVILRIVAPVEPFGERALLGGTTRLSSAQALDDSRALVWEAPTILQVMMSHPAVSLDAVRLMEDRLEQERSRLQDLSTAPVERRLARLVLRLAQSMGHMTPQGIAIELSLSGQDLAELASATPSTISRILAEWRRSDIVDARRERIFILNLQRIAAIAGVGGDALQAGLTGNAP